jgi:hypothetical protein
MFSFLDLTFILPAVAAIVGAIFVTIQGNTIAAIAISWLTAAVFCYAVYYFYAMKYAAYRSDYATADKLRVRIGVRNKPTKSMVEEWTATVFAMYLEQKVIDCKMADLQQAVYDKLAVFLDKEKLSVLDRFVRGYSTSGQMVVGYQISGGYEYVASLFSHELEHHILNQIGVSWNEKVHHTLMQQIRDSLPNHS